MYFLRLLNSFCVTPKKESQIDQIQQSSGNYRNEGESKGFSFLGELFLKVCSGWGGL